MEASPLHPNPPSLPPTGTSTRRHDLDALRAIAMLLGIVLHVGLAYMPLPIWPVQDHQQSEDYGILFAAIHGFRMPLFFLISGFFTAMLWRKRGLHSLILHRVQRILAPLIVGMATIIPTMWLVIFFAEFTKPDPAPPVTQSIESGTDSASGVKASDDNQAVPGASPLSDAAMRNNTNRMARLFQEGTDANQRNPDGNTALHGASFLGRTEAARMLLENGADPNARNYRGETPSQVLKTPWGITAWIAEDLLKIPVDQREVEAGREEIHTMLVHAGAKKDPFATLRSIWTAIIYAPIFHHLWFLWYLCWLVGIFCIYARICQRARVRRISRALVTAPGCWLWILPLTLILQMSMTQDSFGPDTASGFIPAPHVLAYYSIFFMFGVLYFDADDREGKLGRWWWLLLPVSCGIFIVYLMVEEVLGIWSDSLVVLYTWTMTFAWIGVFRHFFRRDNRIMRYISDSSYWLYVVHLPLVWFVQSFMRTWSWPSGLKFAFVTVSTTALLLLSYQYLIRYRILGTFLNGPRTRPVRAPAADPTSQ